MEFKKYSNGSWTDTPVYKYNKTAAGAPNLINNNLTPKTERGITLTLSGDAAIFSGTATANISFYLVGDEALTTGSTLIEFQKLGKGKYTIGGNPDDAATNKYLISMRYKATEEGEVGILRFPVGGTAELDNTDGSYTYIAPYISIWNGQTVEDLVFTPFIKPIADSWYGIEAFRRESGSWTDTPSFGKRKRKRKAKLVNLDEM